MGRLYKDCVEKLTKYGQLHVFKYFDELSETEKDALEKQIMALDMDIFRACKERELLNIKGEIAPLAAMEIDEIEQNRDEYEQAGITALKQGKIAAMLLAGGMGTRLGSDDPKGMYNIGITRDLYIFECLFNNMMDVVRKTGSYFHVFIMTSDKNHEQTIKFLDEKAYFGYKKEYVHFFEQELSAATDLEGKMYMEEKGKIATSPNGNGGWFISLKRAGWLDFIHEKGIEWLNVFSVDNVLQKICDPVFAGATILSKCEVSSKVVRKAFPDEKVGVMCLEDGKPSIVEYYELTDEMRDTKNEKGDPAYNFGVILNYLFKVEALERISKKEMALHIVKKKIPYINEDGAQVKPEEPNGLKYENLVLDMVHEMDSCLAFEVIRQKEFAPIKNKDGVDSVETARELLRQNGVKL